MKRISRIARKLRIFRRKCGLIGQIALTVFVRNDPFGFKNTEEYIGHATVFAEEFFETNWELENLTDGDELTFGYFLEMTKRSFSTKEIASSAVTKRQLTEMAGQIIRMIYHQRGDVRSDVCKISEADLALSDETMLEMIIGEN